MPCSSAKARILLKETQAVVVRRTPFTIQLTIATGETKQPISLGVDAGYKHVGLSASTEKAELYASEVELRQDITDLLSTRLALRRSRRNRKTRYRAPMFRAKRTSRANSLAFGTFANMSYSETGTSASIVTANRKIRCSTSITWKADVPAAILLAIYSRFAKPVTRRCTVARSS